MRTRISELYHDNKFPLFTYRVCSRSFKMLLNRISTIWWRFNLKGLGENCLIEWGVSFEYPKNVIIGDNVYIGKDSRFVSELREGYVVIGDNTHIGYRNIIDCTGGVEIGEGTLTSADVKIFSHSHGLVPRSKPIPKKITIGKGVWLGIGVTVLESTGMIDDLIIIGAKSLVSKTCNIKGGVYGGIPSRIIKKTQ